MKTRITELLREELVRRKSANRRYSIRAFARHLGVSQTSVSYILNGTRKPSVPVLEKILFALKVPVSERHHLLSELSDEYKYIDLNEAENLQLTRDWYYFAILSLADLSEFDVNPSSVSKRLNISIASAKDALDFLKKKEFLVSKGDRLVPSGYRFNVGDHAAVRNIHRAFLGKAQEIIERLGEAWMYENSDFSEMFMAIDAKDIPWAKGELQKFRRSLARKLEQKKSKNAIVALCIQLLPLTNGN